MKEVFNKRGAAHFEMIVSFVFFVGFVLFLFSVLTPYNETPFSQTVLDSLSSEFALAAGTNLTTFFLNVNSTESCFNIDLSTYSDSFEYDFSNSKVFDLNGNEVSSELDSSGNLKVSSSVDNNFYVFISPEFSTSSVGSCNNPNSFAIGSIQNRVVISNSSLANLKERYFDNYTLLKEELKIPFVFDFEIISEDFSENNLDRQIPNSVEVYAKDYVLQVLNGEGKIINSKFTFRVW